MVLKYKLKLTPEKIPSFSRKVFSRLKKIKLDKEILFDIKLALEESLINAVKHGNRMDFGKHVFLCIEAQNKRLTIEVEDEGEGFDYHNINIPTDKKNLEKLSGRGVFLIKKIMDEVSFFNNGRGIRMVKNIKGGEHENNGR